MRGVASEQVTINDLRSLSAALPPSERVNGAEVADVLSALVAVVTHGRAVLEASREGSNGVYDFLHTKAVDKAQADGTEVPAKGQQISQPSQPVTPVASTQQAIDYDQLAAAIVRAQQTHQAADEATTEKVTAEPVASDTPATTDTPVHQGERGNEPTAADVAAAQSQESVSDEGIL